MTTNRVITNRVAEAASVARATRAMRAVRSRRLALACAVACAAAFAFGGCAKKDGGAAGGSGGGMEMPPMPVETAAVVSETVFDRFQAVGSVEAGEAVTIVAEINGTIRQLPFREGETIRKGALIAQLDDDELLAEANRTEAWRDQQKTSYDRIKTIVDQKAGSPQALDDAGAALKMAEADHALARARHAKTRITAPFDGTIGIRRVSPGAFVRAGDAITELVQTREIKVTFSAPERYVGRLVKGTPVQVSTIAFPGESLSGQIDAVEASLDAATRSVRVLARVANPQDRFRPGMSANISAILSERANALTIPDEAIFAEGDKFFVYVVQADNTVARAALTLGTRLPGTVEVLSGLEPGMRVVRAGHQKLFPGAKVMAVDSHSQVGAAPAGDAVAGSAPTGDAGGAGATSATPAEQEGAAH